MAIDASRRAFLASAAVLAIGCRRRRSKMRARVPGMAVAILRGPSTSFESRGELGRDTLVEVASLGKPVFARAVVRAASAGVLDLDAPMPSIAPPPYRHDRLDGVVDAFDDARLAKLTPRLILSHRSGLPNWSHRAPLSFVGEPGASFGYSGEAYRLLQRALESRLGRSLDDFVRDEIFAVAPMNTSTFDPTRAHRSGHDVLGRELPSSVASPNAATSLLSTASDYASFVRLFLDGGAGDPVTRAMLQSATPVDEGRRLSFGLGMALAEPEWFFHWGANPGVRSLVVGSIARREAVVVLTDGDGGMERAADVVRSVFGELPLLGWPRLYPKD